MVGFHADRCDPQRRAVAAECDTVRQDHAFGQLDAQIGVVAVHIVSAFQEVDECRDAVLSHGRGQRGANSRRVVGARNGHDLCGADRGAELVNHIIGQRDVERFALGESVEGRVEHVHEERVAHDREAVHEALHVLHREHSARVHVGRAFQQADDKTQIPLDGRDRAGRGEGRGIVGAVDRDDQGLGDGRARRVAHSIGEGVVAGLALGDVLELGR